MCSQLKRRHRMVGEMLGFSPPFITLLIQVMTLILTVKQLVSGSFALSSDQRLLHIYNIFIDSLEK